MDPQAAPRRNPKYAWRDIARAEAPKRAVNDRIADFRATYRPYDAATAAEQASRCIQCPHPSCAEACPLDTPIPELMRLAADGSFREAAQLLLATNSMPELFVHVCAGERVCEAACVLAGKSGPVPISAIGRFVLDYGWNEGLFEPPVDPPSGRSVAVVGAGLCGLVAADELSRRGHAVTVFDDFRKPGGRLVNGIPGFRVDRELIERRVGLLSRRGVQFTTGVVCGRDLKLGQLRRDFDAVFFGFGRANPVPLEIAGAKLHGVRQAYPFVLRHTSDATIATPPVSVFGKRVVVLGGGETAVDALRVAIRCGAGEAVCVYRRDRDDMPASPAEVDSAEEEGARFLFLLQATAVLGDVDGNVTAVRCARMKAAGLDATGRTRVEPVPGAEIELPADVVLVAYGYRPPLLTRVDEFAELATGPGGFLLVNDELMTNLPGVFAGGSVVHGPEPLIEVVRDARRASVSIHEYLTRRSAAPVPGSAVFSG